MKNCDTKSYATDDLQHTALLARQDESRVSHCYQQCIQPSYTNDEDFKNEHSDFLSLIPRKYLNSCFSCL